MKGNWLIPFKRRGCSGLSNDNFLWNENNIYIMDNHRLSLWCWLQYRNKINTTDLIHIDRHYDFIEADSSEGFDDLQQGWPDDLKTYRTASTEGIGKDTRAIIRYDNYLNVLYKYFPQFVGQGYYFTHNDGDKPQNISFEDITNPLDLMPRIHELFRKEGQYIVNIDIDYFFQTVGEENFQFFSDPFVRKFSGVIVDAYRSGKIAVLTIALSPEYCGTWRDSERVCGIICDGLELNFKLPKDDTAQNKQHGGRC